MDEKYLKIIRKQQELISLLLNLDNDEINENPVETSINDTTFNDTALIQEEQSEFELVENHEVKCDIEGFTKWLKKKGRSNNCIDTYVRGIELFYRQHQKMTIETLTEYEEEINSKFSPKTVNLRIAGMQAYFKYTGFKGIEFRRAKIQQKTYCDNAVNETQYNQLVDYLFENNYITIWKAVLVIGNTGVRVSELISLKTEYLDKGFADITGKGNKTRRIYFPKNLVKKIKPYCNGKYIVENRYGQQLTSRGISSQLQRYGIKAGLPKEVLHPHSFRHFFAKQFMKKNDDITLLGDLLGHSNISTTAIYTRLTTEEQKEQMNKLVNW